MREKLFRGKRIDNGEWVYGFYFCMYHDDDRKHLHHFIIPLNVPIPKDKPIGEIQVEVNPDTVGQYTGLTDKNGKKIFEGDIAKNPINDGIFVVKYKNSLACFLGISIHGNPSTGLCSGFEVIGNIHDNPELLEVEP
nr:YopX family protein [uncultured Ruminococcus sp.]